jgi:hypothetical protein
MDVALDVSAGRRRDTQVMWPPVIPIEFRPGSQEVQSGDGSGPRPQDRHGGQDRGRWRGPPHSPVQHISPGEVTLRTVPGSVQTANHAPAQCDSAVSMMSALDATGSSDVSTRI